MTIPLNCLIEFIGLWEKWWLCYIHHFENISWLIENILLTHLPLDKMAAILTDDIFKCIFLNENDRILIQISLQFVPRSSVDNNPALVQHVQVMAWHPTGDKSLPESLLTQFTNAYTVNPLI